MLEVWKATTTVENPLFFHENSQMLFGDAKKNVDAAGPAPKQVDDAPDAVRRDPAETSPIEALVDYR